MVQYEDKEKLIKIITNRAEVDEEYARALIKETRDEIVSNPEDTEEIIKDYLGLEPDYLETILSF